MKRRRRRYESQGCRSLSCSGLRQGRPGGCSQRNALSKHDVTTLAIEFNSHAREPSTGEMASNMPREAQQSDVASPRSIRRQFEAWCVVENDIDGNTNLDCLEAILPKHADNCNLILNDEWHRRARCNARSPTVSAQLSRSSRQCSNRGLQQLPVVGLGYANQQRKHPSSNATRRLACFHDLPASSSRKSVLFFCSLFVFA